MINKFMTTIGDLIGYDEWSPVQKIASSFLLVILVGAFLLSLPIANRDGQWLNFLDALFTSTSATCVTGLVTHVTVEQFTVFGQMVLIALMQIGGLGLMTFMAVVIVVMKNRLSMNDKIVMREMLNQDTLFNMHLYVKNIFRYTFLFEAIGLCLFALVFVPEFGLIKGLFVSLFTAVSAFCNAGFDIVGAQSLVPYATNGIINFTVMGLIIAGGLGFAVWFDLHDRLAEFNWKEYSNERFFTRSKELAKDFWKSLHLHTKIVCLTTIVLILGGAVIIFLLEAQNPNTLGEFSFFDKWMVALFQSVTLRTAGFATIDIGMVADPTKLLMSMFMFIGGSPGGTAGGVKTTTIFLLFLFVYSSLKSRDSLMMFKRSIGKDILLRSVLIVCVNFTVMVCGVFILSITENAAFIDIVFEAASAIGTVGLTTGLTPNLSSIGKVVIIMLMYLGRIGVITMILSILRKRMDISKNKVIYPSENLIIG